MTTEDSRRQVRSAGRVPAQVSPDHWQAARYRCACGYASDDADEFGGHLDATDGAEPEHFEVVDDWTLQQLKLWQTSATTPSPPD